MIDKEFVLVSQGIEIYRTKSQEKAVGMVKEHNDEYFDYLQKCYDNYERPADNYVDLEIEYSNEKEKDKVIERLNNKNEELLTLYTTEREVKDYYKDIVNELEKYLEKIIIDGGTRGSMTFWYRQIYDKLQKLKGSDDNG